MWSAPARLDVGRDPAGSTNGGRGCERLGIWAELSQEAGSRDVLDPTEVGTGQGVVGGTTAPSDTAEHENDQRERDQRLPVRRRVQV